MSDFAPLNPTYAICWGWSVIRYVFGIGVLEDSKVLYLHKEGIFYKLYNQDAMLFTENIKPLKISVVGLLERRESGRLRCFKLCNV